MFGNVSHNNIKRQFRGNFVDGKKYKSYLNFAEQLCGVVEINCINVKYYHLNTYITLGINYP